MATATLDTHRIVKRLREAGFSDLQAETVTDLLKETREFDLAQLATKADLADLATKKEVAEIKLEIAEIKREITQVETRIIKWLVPLMFAQVAAIVALLRLL